MKKFIQVILISGIAAVMCLACKSNGKEEESEIGKKQFEVEKNPVDTIHLQSRNFNSQLISNGKLRAQSKSSLKFAISGIVAELNGKNGDLIQAGDVIARLDTREAALKLEQAQFQMEKAEIELADKLLGYGYKQSDSLQIPPETMRIARIHSGYNDALSNLKASKMSYENCTLLAPVSGKLANLKTKRFEYPSAEEFCQVINDGIFEVEFFILETELANLKNGQNVVISTFTEAEKRYSGKVVEINPVVNEKGQITAKAQFQNPGHLIDGMNVKVYLENIIPNKLVVPKSAVLIRDNQEVLFRVNAEGKAEWTYVHITHSNSDSYAVIANNDKGADLNEGDIVIITGNLNLAHGSSIEIKQQ